MEETKPAAVLPEGLYHLKSPVSNPHARSSQAVWQFAPTFTPGFYLVRRFVTDTKGTLSSYPGIERATRQGEPLFDGILQNDKWPDAYARLSRALDPVVPERDEPKPKPKLVKKAVTVTIEFNVPENANLDGAYVTLSSDLMDVRGDLICSSWDCETDSIEDA